MTRDDFKLERIDHAMVVGQIGNFIAEYIKKVDIPGIVYPTLHTYFCNSVQTMAMQTANGHRPNMELWLVRNKEGKPIAFAHWYVMSIPYVESVCIDHIYSWNTLRIPFNMLVDKLIEFAKDHKCRIIHADAVNDRVYTVGEKAFKDRGLIVKRSGRIRMTSYWGVK